MDNFGGWGQPKESRRDRLEIDHQGETTAQRKKRKQEEQQAQWNDMQNGNYGGNYVGGPFSKFKNRFSMGRRGGGYGRGGSQGGSWLGFIVAIGIVAFLIWLVYKSLNGGLVGPLRSFNSTQDSNITAFQNAFLDMEAKNKVSNSDPKYAVYEKNRIYKSDFLESQVFPEYIVYVYTGDPAKDKEFTDFVLEWEKDSTLPPIYRIAMYDIQEHHQIQQAIPYGQPGFAIYKGKQDGGSLFDSAILDSVHFPKIKDYMLQLQEEYNELQKTRVGKYGQSKGFSKLLGEDNPNLDNSSNNSEGATTVSDEVASGPMTLEDYQALNPDIVSIDEYGVPRNAYGDRVYLDGEL